MADERLQVNVDFSNHPELYDELKKYVDENDTDASKFIRQLVRAQLMSDKTKVVVRTKRERIAS